MNVCLMCRKRYERTNEDKLENGAPICPKCAEQFNVVLTSNESRKVRSAMNYIYSCSVQTDDRGVKKCLNAFLSSNASVFEELEEDEKHRANMDMPVDVQKNDYFAEDGGEEGYLKNAADPGICNALAFVAVAVFIFGAITAVIAAFNLERWLLPVIGIILGTTVMGLVPLSLAHIISYLAKIERNIRK